MKSLDKIKKRVDLELERYFQRATVEASKRDEELGSALEYVHKITMAGGKRLRPALMQFGYIAAGGKNLKEINKVSISTELIHMFLLIHDDIMDRGTKRHGVETAHVHYQKICQRASRDKDCAHFGTSIGILIGDTLHSLGNQVLYNSAFEPRHITRALMKMEDVVYRTIAGQVKDVRMEYTSQASEKDVLQMYEFKTARYTFEGPLHLGAILAGGQDELLKILSDYSVPLGIAFQIQDDILGLFGSEKKLGKSVASDVEEGKQTLLIVKALEWADQRQQEIIRATLGKSKVTKGELEVLRAVVRETGSLEYARTLAREKTLEGKAAIEKANVVPVAKKFLLEIADHLLNREI
ncbi:polyprenyl synthetase family protein [Patescibacteria group bacterium]|nr:MAG: polyprenyl synthetase family protein [Patescibacteria group bacterium]